MQIVYGAIAAIVYTAFVFFMGVTYEGRAGKVAELSNQIVSLKGQLAAHKAASEADAATLEAARPEIERLEGVSREIAEKISDGVCFSGDDVAVLRKLRSGITVRPTGADTR